MIPLYLVNFMKDKRKIKIKIAVISAVVVYIIVSVVLALLFWDTDDRLTPGVEFYGLSDGATSVMYNTSPELDIAYVTENMQVPSDTIYYSPGFVVGEGKDDNNGTVVRVFNEKQICTTQFAAFPSTVKGGVRIAAGKTDVSGQDVTLIATAAYGVYCDDARCVRVYDTNGMLYMKITPEFWSSAPFAIITGHFVKGDDSEYLLISESVVKNGKIGAELYSLSDGAMVDSYAYVVGTEHNDKNITLSVRNTADNNDSIIVFAKAPDEYKVKYIKEEAEKDISELYAAFEGKPAEGIKEIDIELPEGATGVYSSSDSEKKYIVTSENKINDDSASYVYAYGDNDKKGKLLYVDYEEKRLFWHADKNVIETVGLTERENSFIRYADEFVVDSDNPEEIIKKAVHTSEFAYWKVKLSEYGIEPVRSVYKSLTDEYRRNPSGMVMVEIFTASDLINDISLDDNAESVRKEFVDYLLQIYGSVENINDKFKKSFSSENDINIPEKPNGYDEYSDDLYYTEWYKFTRVRVGKRMTAAYAAAIAEGLSPNIITSDTSLAGYMPEPEKYSNINFDDYINPLSVVPEGSVYSLGASVGLSGNGLWYENPYNAMSLAFSAGFKDIAVSSYSSETEFYSKPYYQFLYMLRNGAKYVGISSDNYNYASSDLNALDVLAQKGESRSGYAYGTGKVVAVEHNGKKYDLVVLGTERNSLLKSIDNDGLREGSVYVVPFHEKIKTTGAKVHNNPRRDMNVGTFDNVTPGSQIEVRFIASGGKADNSYVKINVYHDGYLLEDACTTYKLTGSEKYYRYVFKNNLELGKVKIEIDCICEEYSEFSLSDVDMSFQCAETVYPAKNDYKGVSAEGGVSFDIISRDSLYSE